MWEHVRKIRTSSNKSSLNLHQIQFGVHRNEFSKTLATLQYNANIFWISMYTYFPPLNLWICVTYFQNVVCILIKLKSYVLHMCFARFLLAFESCDVSQADKSISRVSSFPNWAMNSGTSFSVSQAWGLYFLQYEFCQSSQIYLSPEKTEKTVYFDFSGKYEAGVP